MLEIIGWAAIVTGGFLGAVIAAAMFLYIIDKNKWIPHPRFLIGFKEAKILHQHWSTSIYYKKLETEVETDLQGIKVKVTTFIFRDAATWYTPFRVEVKLGLIVNSIRQKQPFFIKGFTPDRLPEFTIRNTDSILHYIIDDFSENAGIREEGRYGIIEDRFFSIIMQILEKERQQSIQRLVYDLKQKRR